MRSLSKYHRGVRQDLKSIFFQFFKENLKFERPIETNLPERSHNWTYNEWMKSPGLSTRQPNYTHICDPALRVFGCIIWQAVRDYPQADAIASQQNDQIPLYPHGNFTKQTRLEIDRSAL
jgi:hypothetical protein